MIRDNDYPCGTEIIINEKILHVGKLINQGADGRIYAVDSDGSMYPAVVKYFSCMYEDELYNSALLEIEAAQRLEKCPYTVEVLGYCVRMKPDGMTEIFIMMEKMQCCDDIQPGLYDVLQMGMDICLALAYMHRRGLVHCDIKPSNIFLSSDVIWKLGDFGCTQLKGRCIRRGSPAYCAPEVSRGARCNTVSDIYSLGIVLYKLLNGGRLPFCPKPVDMMTPDEVENAIRRRLSGESIPPIDGLDMELNHILLQMCEFLPHKRIQSPKKLAEMLGCKIKY